MAFLRKPIFLPENADSMPSRGAARNDLPRRNTCGTGGKNDGTSREQSPVSDYRVTGCVVSKRRREALAQALTGPPLRLRTLPGERRIESSLRTKKNNSQEGLEIPPDCGVERPLWRTLWRSVASGYLEHRSTRALRRGRREPGRPGTSSRRRALPLRAWAGPRCPRTSPRVDVPSPAHRSE